MARGHAEKARQMFRELTKPKAGPAAIAAETGSKSAKPDAAGLKAMPAELPPAESIEVYYDRSKGCFWGNDARGEWMLFSEGQLRRLLQLKGFNKERFHGRGINEVDHELLRIQLEKNVDFAGALGGYHPGLHQIQAWRVLITKGPKLLTPKRGSWPTLRKFLDELLGDQGVYLVGWLKHAIASLRAGDPWAPGQLLAIAGPSGSGKSFMQGILTELLGGRGNKPFRYLSGKSDFNGDLFSCEHLYLEDEIPAHDIKSRRAMGAAIKNLLVNEVQSVHPKGKDAMPMTPFVRMSLTLNDDGQNLLVLPPHEESVWEKIILLRASCATFPVDDGSMKQRNGFKAAIRSELPAFLYYLDRWSIPKEKRHRRYGVSTFHHPDLLREMFNLSPESRLLDLVDSSGILDEANEAWSGTARELEMLLKTRDKSGEAEKLLTYHTACGQYLSKLAERRKERVLLQSERHNVKTWLILKDDFQR